MYNADTEPQFLPTNAVSVGSGGHGIPPSLQHAAENGHLPARIAQLVPPLH